MGVRVQSRLAVRSNPVHGVLWRWSGERSYKCGSMGASEKVVHWELYVVGAVTILGTSKVHICFPS